MSCLTPWLSMRIVDWSAAPVFGDVRWLESHVGGMQEDVGRLGPRIGRNKSVAVIHDQAGPCRFILDHLDYAPLAPRGWRHTAQMCALSEFKFRVV